MGVMQITFSHFG